MNAARRHIRVDLGAQTLELYDAHARVRAYAASTSRYGAGEQDGSFKTPRGRHVVRAKIGAGQPYGAVFRGRRPTGEVYSRALAAAEPRRDWILSRILWLSGTQVGYNRLGAVDTMRRYVYIHGAPDDAPMGEPASIGCIRLSNPDVIELFDLVAPGTVVDIAE